MIKRLWNHLTKHRRKQFLLLSFLMIIASVMEIISIGSVVPFLGALTNPENIYNNDLAQPLILILNITEPKQLLLPLTIFFVTATLISALIRLLLLYTITRFSFATGADLSIDIYRRTLYQDYSTHLSRNSSEVINGIITKTNLVISKIIVPILNFISSFVIMIGIIVIIFTINASIAIISFVVFGIFYLIIASLTKKTLQKNSQLISNQSNQMVKSLQEGLGGIRDVLIDGAQEFYCKLYRDADLSFRRASGDNVFIASCPRYVMEGIGMILIAILAYGLTLQGGISSAFPVLGALAVGAQKLLPALQQLFSSYSLIKGGSKPFSDVLDLLDQPLPSVFDRSLIKPIPFNSDIAFKNVSFQYSIDTPLILKNVELKFKKGEKIGLMGVTGSGKSTLLDILMGLLIPTSGKLLIDGKEITNENRKNWQTHISHVPQNIFLADGTIQENIAFGVSKNRVKKSKIIQAAKQAKIAETISTLKDEYRSIVGEQGVQLSGGQRQRIGIARALYKDSNVIIFDEATSALDNETEEDIMQQIDQLHDDKTIFIIAHRLTTLKNCDRIIRLNKNFKIEEIDYKLL
jgi:ATP-binding cassette subfamily B protein